MLMENILRKFKVAPYPMIKNPNIYIWNETRVSSANPRFCFSS